MKTHTLISILLLLTAPFASASDDSSGVAGVALIIVALALYLLPSIIGQDKRNANAIFALNVFLGWTFIGWVIALTWALTKDAEKPERIREAGETCEARTPIEASPPPPPPGTPTPRGIYLAIHGKVEGPYTTTQVEGFLQNGSAALDTPCCIEGHKEWQPLSNLAS